MRNLKWRTLNNKNTISLVRSFLLMGAVISAISIKFIVSEEFSNYISLLQAIIAISILFPIVFLKKYLNYKKIEHAITIDEIFLTIPTAMMWDKKIELSKIKSIEYLSYLGKSRGILIGLHNGSANFVSAESFEAQDLFEDFKNQLVDFAVKENSENLLKNKEKIIIENIGRSDKAATLFVILIVFSYLITVMPGWGKVTDDAIKIGALTKSSLEISEIYRIAVSFFLHLDIGHLLLNIFCLAVIGGNVNKITGNFRFILAFLGSAIAGSVLSLRFSDSEYVIGASGGIMGLLGTYSVICLRYQRLVSGSVATAGRNIVAIVLLQLVLDSMINGVDGLSHIGGLLFGILYAVFFLNENQLKNISHQTLTETVVGIFVGSFYLSGLFYFMFIYLKSRY